MNYGDVNSLFINGCLNSGMTVSLSPMGGVTAQSWKTGSRWGMWVTDGNFGRELKMERLCYKRHLRCQVLELKRATLSLPSGETLLDVDFRVPWNTPAM